MSEKVPLLSQPAKATSSAKYTLVIHGGAGTMDKSRSTPELRKEYKAALSRALLATTVSFVPTCNLVLEIFQVSFLA